MRRAKLEVKRNELLPAIDQKKNKLNLNETKRHLKQLKNNIKSQREQTQAVLVSEETEEVHTGRQQHEDLYIPSCA